MDYRKELKNIDKEKYQRPIYFHDDLTARRAKLAYQLKNTGKIVDTWVIDSKVIVMSSSCGLDYCCDNKIEHALLAAISIISILLTYRQ